jgi:glutamate synthase (NADPH/NADH) large chain
MYEYMASVMEPWDGPAALAMTDGRWAVAGVDRNALRPLRYTLTPTIWPDRRFGNRHGRGAGKRASSQKGRMGPGQMLAVDLTRASLSRPRDQGSDRGRASLCALVKGFRKLSDLPAGSCGGPPVWTAPN